MARLDLVWAAFLTTKTGGARAVGGTGGGTVTDIGFSGTEGPRLAGRN